MKIIRFTLIIALLLLCINCGKEGPPSDKGAETGKKAEAAGPGDDKIVLQINDKQFSNKDFIQFIRVNYPDISITPPAPASASSASSPATTTESAIEITPKLLSRLFDSFLEHKTIVYIANQMDIPVERAEIDDYLEKINISDKDIDRDMIIEPLKVQKYLHYKIYDNITVTDKEIRDYYNTHRDEFRKKMQVLLYQILVKDKDTAVKIRGELKNAPRKFEEIAKNQSISMENEKGGLMGYFEKGTLPLDMENVVFSLKPYSISPVVESSYGFHIFKITKKKQGRTLYLKDAKPGIENKLLSEKMGRAYREFLAKAKQELMIEIKYNALYFDYQSIEGDNEDENKETIHSNSPGNPPA